MTDFGSLFSAHLIEEGALKTLRDWMDLYVEEVEGQYGGLKLPKIKSWGLSSAYDRWSEQALPALVVAADGIGRGGPPEEYGGGNYRAGWSLGVSVTVEHPKPDGARKAAQLYAAVTRGILLQRRSLGAGGRVASWVDEGYPTSISERRTRAAAENVFVVVQDEVVNWQLGPKGDTPPPDLPGPDLEIKEVDVDAEVK
jgi:hypothetical protein